MKVSVPFELDEIQALRLFVRVLDMENLTCGEEQLYIHGGKVCRKDENGEYEAVDDRADLFAALRNVINALVPNCDFRSDPYITHYCDGDDAEWTNCDEALSEWDVREFAGGMDYDGYVRDFRCKKCGHQDFHNTKYCHECGRLMRNGIGRTLKEAKKHFKEKDGDHD